MSRIPRRHQWASEVCYHLMNRGHDREAIFADDEDRHALLGLVQRYQRRFGFRLYHYCSMSNHFHLLVQLADPRQVSRLMAGLLRAYARTTVTVLLSRSCCCIWGENRPTPASAAGREGLYPKEFVMRQPFSRRRLLGGFLAGLCGTWLGRDRSAPAASPGPAPAPAAAPSPTDFVGEATPCTCYAASPAFEGDMVVWHAYDAGGRLLGGTRRGHGEGNTGSA
jgi:REP element-mobilizing transposase RayT